MGKFAMQVHAGIEEMQGNLQKGVRQFYLELFMLIIQRSPVGNTRNWKINQHQATANDWAAHQNTMRRNTASTSYVRKLKGGGTTRVIKRNMKATGESVRPTRWGKNTSAAGPRRHIVRRGGDMWRGPKGYQGGRFRANWQFTLEAGTAEVLDALDPSGALAIDALKSGLRSLDITTSKAAFFSNNLDYAMAIEFGVPGKHPLWPVWSKQAPQGVVRVSLADAQEIWNRIFL